MKIALLALALALSAHSQTAKVVALSPEDAKHAQELDARQKALTAETEAFHNSVVEKYLTTKSEKEGGFLYPDYLSLHLTATAFIGCFNIGIVCRTDCRRESQSSKGTRGG